MVQPQLMPDFAVDDDWLTVQDLRADIGVVLRKLDRHQFSDDPRLATEGNSVVRTRILNDHVLENPQHALGRLQDGESDMAPATGHSHLTDKGGKDNARPAACACRQNRSDF